MSLTENNTAAAAPVFPTEAQQQPAEEQNNNNNKKEEEVVVEKPLTTTPAAAAAASVDYNDDFLDLFEAPVVISDDQRQKVEQLRQKIEPVAAEILCPSQLKQFRTFRSVFLARHLISRKFVVDDALKMIKDTGEFRKKNHLDTIPIFPNPNIYVRGYNMDELVKLRGCGAKVDGPVDAALRQVQQASSECYHYWDKGGRPLYIAPTGTFLVDELVERVKSATAPGAKPAQVFADIHLRANEVSTTLMEYTHKMQVVPGAKPAHSITCIFDCDGLEMKHKAILDLMSIQNSNDMSFNAESLHRVYLANAPAVARVLWSIFSIVLDARTCQKVTLFSPSETKSELLKYIDAACLPASLGGSCRCGGLGCIPPPLSSIATKGSPPAPMGPTRNFVVPNGKTHELSYALKKGDTATYGIFMAEKSINFGARFVPSAVALAGEQEQEQPVIVKEVAKTEGLSDGSYVCAAEGGGKIVFEFSNGATFRDKNVCFACIVTAASEGQPDTGNGAAAAVAA